MANHSEFSAFNPYLCQRETNIVLFLQSNLSAFLILAGLVALID